MVKVFPGEFYVTNKADEVLVTVLRRASPRAFAILSSASAE